MFRATVDILGYVVRDGRVLLAYRQHAGDDHRGRWNGFGGRPEPGEDAAACLKQGFREGAETDATSLRLRGTVA